MNDSAEFTHGLDVARRLLIQRLQATTEVGDKARIDVLLKDLDSIAMVNVFVASFSATPDLLSQWRAYGDASGAFALGFRSSTLSELAGQHGFALKQCQYDEAWQRELVEHLVDVKLAERFDPSLSTVDPDTPRTLRARNPSGDFALRISELASTLKHPNFAEESEWRLVSKWIGATTPQFSHRPGPLTVTPYFALPLAPSTGALVEVLVGPTEHKELARSSIQSLLLRHGYKDVNIVQSRTPLRAR